MLIFLKSVKIAKTIDFKIANYIIILRLYSARPWGRHPLYPISILTFCWWCSV